MNKIEKALVGVYCKMHKGFNNLMQDEKGEKRGTRNTKWG